MLYAFNKGEVCTCPSRALDPRVDLRPVHGALPRRGSRKIIQGNPLDTATMIGPQISAQQLEKIESYVEIGRQEGAECLIGGRAQRARGRPRGRLLLRADGAEGQQQDAGLPRGDLRAGARGDDVQRRGRSDPRSPTTPSTGSAPASGRATATAPTAWVAASRPDGCGRTATTSTRRERPSAATRSRASGGRTTR